MADIKNSKRTEVGPKTSTKALDNAIYTVIAAIFFLCPLFFTGMVSQGLGFEKMALFYFLVLLGSVVWVIKGVFKGELDVKRTPLDIPIVVTLLLFVVSTILSVSQKDSLIGAYGSPAKGLVAVLVFALFYYLVTNNIDTKRVKLYVSAFAASVGLIVIYSLLQLFGFHILPFAFSKSTNFNPVGSFSGLTMLLSLALPIFTVLAAQFQYIFPKMNPGLAKALKILFIVLLFLALTALVLLNVFTFWLALILSSVIVLIFFMAKIIPISTGNLLIPAAVFFASIVFFVIGNIGLFQMKLPTEISLSRGASWDIAKSSLRENPIFGSGPSTFFYDFSKHKSIDFNSSPLWNVRFDSASGSFFELLSTVGVLGTLSIIVIGLIVLSLSFLSLIKTKTKELNPLMLGLFSSFVTLILLSLLFTQDNTLILVNVFIGVLTFATALIIYPEKFQTINLSFRAAPKYALALAAISLTVFAGVVVLFTMGLKTYMADVHAKTALAAANTDKKISSLNKAVSLAPYQDKYYLTLANSYISKANQAVVDGGDLNDINGWLSQSIANGKKAVELAPNSASNNEALALVYENASFYTRGALEQAEQLYNNMMELEPTNPTPYLRIALVNMAKSNTETDQEEKEYFINQAITYYDKALERKRDLAAANYGKAVAYEKLNDLDKAIVEMEKVNFAASGNVDYMFELGRLLFNRGITSPTIKQNATEQITTNELEQTGEEGEESAIPNEELSVEPVSPGNTVIEKNDDLTNAEQIFLSILAGGNPNHANALYSLAVLYKKVGEENNLTAVVSQLMNVIDDNATKDAIRQQFPEAF